MKDDSRNQLFEMMAEMGHEQVMFCCDEASGYRAVIAIHSTRLGPAVGGTRFWNYSTENEALIDALRLSHERQEMTQLTTQAELRALRAQVNPHFLFNALNTIGFLIQTAPTRAHATLMKLTSLLRAVLRSSDAAVALGDEIDLVDAYLEIERARFEERLQVTIDVPSPLRRVLVPPLILQPLVENAIKHGIANSRRGGHVGIRVHADRDLLIITVRNTGLVTNEMEIAQGRRRGVGLANLDARLRHVYGDAARVTLLATPTETCAEVVLPALARDAA